MRGKKKKECEMTRGATPTVFLSVTDDNKHPNESARRRGCRYPIILYCFPLFLFEMEEEGVLKVKRSCVIQNGLFPPTGRFFYFYSFFFCTCSTIEHCTWAPYFTSCQSVKGSEQLRKKKKKRVYTILSGSGFAAVSVAGRQE